MINTHYREKLINAIIYFVTNTKHCGKIKLLKLLYFLDFKHFKQTGNSVTGLDYYTWDFGPVPKNLYEELSGEMKPDLKKAIKVTKINDFFKITQKIKFNPDFFTKREMEILKQLGFIYKDVKTDDMTEITHMYNQPWSKTLKEKGKYQKIDYLLSIDSQDESLSLEEAKERMNEISETLKIFGVV